MGFWDILFPEVHTLGADGVRILDVPTGMNVRELGSYEANGRMTLPHRFIRSGSTRNLNRRDIERLLDYGVTHVLDLRGSAESPQLTCAFARQRGVTWRNVSLFGRDISDPSLIPPEGTKNYLTSSYVTMLGNHAAIRECFEFFADMPEGSCALFHCAAGMDRTGMMAMLLLGLVGVSRDQIVRDYLYSYGSVREIERAVTTREYPQTLMGNRLPSRREAIEETYDTVIRGYGTVRNYLLACEIGEDRLDHVRRHLLGD